jgi:predicted phage terminase large subunit-like protein
MTAQERQAQLIERLLAADKARDDLLAFTQLVMPDPNDPDNPRKSTYKPAKHHRVIAAALEEIEKGTYNRLIINVPPRHGKTELASKRFAAWFAGRHPEKSVIFGTYNEKYAEDIGRKVRETIQSAAFQQVFPDVGLKDGSKASDRLETTAGGILAFVGRGGTITGRGGDILVVDDPLKDRREADSPAIRDTLWGWWTDTFGSRAMTDEARILLIQTRWHEDDLVGRLTDPLNAFYDEEEARQWKIIDLPALAFEDEVDPLGRKPGEALWPERFGADWLLTRQRQNPRGFASLYQGRPSAIGGNFFQDEWLQTYKPNELPKNLRIYAASDHAVSTAQDRDKTCLIPVGVDDKDNIYILPDVWWRSAPTDKAVEAMLKIMNERRPTYWWAERGHITKSIGPFLRKRMLEEKVYCAICEVIPLADKLTRAQSIQGRMAMGKVFFPEKAPWWPEARDQLLKFPAAAHDDFVDALAYIGLGLAQQASAGQVRQLARASKPGTFGALLDQSNKARRAQAIAASTGGW